MNNKTRNTVLAFIYDVTDFTQADIRALFNKTRYNTKFDNSVGRFVRRLKANGVIKTTKYGYASTVKGRKMIDSQLA